MPDTTLERVIRVIVKTQHYPPDKAALVTEEATFADLGIDSLDGINIVFALENEFDVSIPDEGAKTMKGVVDIVQGIDKLLSEKSAAS
ncbi:MAG: acyl carrier protein [Bryobacterales bacterium]|nr:acyl carrier protein [Bryobacterales bacterium]